jgi:hypothetical protein
MKRRSKASPIWANKKAIFAILAAIIVILLGLELTNTTHLLHKQKPASLTVVTAGTPVKAPASKKVSPPPKGSSNDSSSPARNQGTATDTQGSASASTNSNQWISSASGAITVKQPVANSKIQDGVVLSGSAKVDEISYRLTDNSVGLIAQGTLSVVNGNFSGILHFKSQGTGGRLDVFSTDSKGVEYNEIQVNVSF